MLAIIILGFGGGDDSFPEVPYPTALDVFIILCLVFLFGAICEFAAIHFLERRANKRRKKLDGLITKLAEELLMVRQSPLYFRPK